jgi:hypothetical protein
MAKSKKDDGTDAKDARATRPQLRSDRLVEKLVPDANSLEPTICLVGFIGESSQAGMWRLYLGPELNEYVEFTEEDVRNIEPIPEEQSSLGGTQVWLRATTTLRYTRITSQQIQADFLQGAITSGYMQGATSAFQATSARAATGVACTRNYVCSTNPHIPACQLRTEVCGTAFCGPNTGPFCPTGAFIHGC